MYFPERQEANQEACDYRDKKEASCTLKGSLLGEDGSKKEDVALSVGISWTGLKRGKEIEFRKTSQEPPEDDGNGTAPTEPEDGVSLAAGQKYTVQLRVGGVGDNSNFRLVVSNALLEADAADHATMTLYFKESLLGDKLADFTVTDEGLQGEYEELHNAVIPNRDPKGKVIYYHDLSGKFVISNVTPSISEIHAKASITTKQGEPKAGTEDIQIDILWDKLQKGDLIGIEEKDSAGHGGSQDSGQGGQNPGDQTTETQKESPILFSPEPGRFDGEVEVRLSIRPELDDGNKVIQYTFNQEDPRKIESDPSTIGRWDSGIIRIKNNNNDFSYTL